jgi:hypothetical protein
MNFIKYKLRLLDTIMIQLLVMYSFYLLKRESGIVYKKFALIFYCNKKEIVYDFHNF